MTNPNCFAIIDIGSSTVKLSVFQIDRAETDTNKPTKKPITAKQLFSASETVNLAEGLYPDLILQKNAIDRTAHKVAELTTVAAEFNPRVIKLVSTGAARKAKNSNALTKEVHKATGSTIDIISSEEEARIFYNGVVYDFNAQAEYFAAINIGGGSTELTLGTKNRIDQLYSLPLGVSALNEKFLKHNPPLRTELKNLEKEIQNQLQLAGIASVEPQTIFIHTGGELAYLQKVGYHLLDSFLSPTHPKQITLVDFIKRSDEVSQMTKEKLRQFMPQNPRWMDGAIACCAVAKNIADHLGLSTIIPSNKNLNDGLLLDLLKEEGIIPSPSSL